jgi:spermidine synthase
MAKKDIKSNFKAKASPYLLLLFFFSGFVSLCYQVIWVRELSVIFGKTNAAITVVVSVFMLGLGLGSLYWGKRKITPGKLSNTFAFLQFGIGGGSVILLLVFPFLSHIYQALVHQLNLSPASILIFIFFLCAVLMFIPSFLMGGTFPVISQLYIRDETKMGKGIGLLYGINTFGGILGAGLTGYFLIGLIGQKETQLLGIIINILIGAWFLKMREPQPLKIEHKKQKDFPKSPDYSLPLQKFLILAAFFTGFAGLAYEILWTRALAAFTSNSIYSFSSILVVFLTGIGIGSYIYSKFLAARTASLPLLVVLQFIIFFVAAITGVFLNDIPILINPFRGLLEYPILRMVFPGLFLSTVIMFLPTLLMGIVFPLICRMYTDSLSHLRARIGKIYFYNTLGSMAGPIAAGFVLIPLVGVVKGIIICAVVNFLLAFSGWFYMEKSANKKKWLLAAAVTFAAVIFLPVILGKSSHILPPSIFRSPHTYHELKHYKETVDGTVVVVEDKKTGVRSCYVNNNAVCGVTYDALKVVHYMGHLPMFFNPKAKNAMIIGFGIGVTTSAIAQHPLENIDCVEICPGVKEAAPLFEKFNLKVWQNPKVNFIAGDGRNYLLLTQRKYDIISCDPVHPGLGSGSLYTKDYFELCKKLMKPGGVISQYLPLHKLTPDDLKTLLNTFYSVFPHSMVWIAQTHGVLIGSPGELRLSFNDILAVINRIDDPFFKDPYLVASTLLLNQVGIKDFVGNHALIHSDNHPILEYFSPESVEAQHHHTNISELLRSRQPAGELISDVPNPVLLDQYIKGQPFYIQGILHHNQGQGAQAFRLFQQALAVNPGNREIRLFYQYLRQRPHSRGDL